MTFFLEAPPEPSDHDLRVSTLANARIAELEGVLRDGLQRSEADRDGEDARAALAVAQAELEFWRSRGGNRGGYRRHDGFAIVPRSPSTRALRTAYGLTDLSDISCSPPNHESSVGEIELAFRIIVEQDGIPISQPGYSPDPAAPPFSVSHKADDRKALLERMRQADADLVAAYVRIEELRAALGPFGEGAVDGEMDFHAARAALSATSEPLRRTTELAPTVKAWLDLSLAR
jgi:hypothetical protein